AQTSSSSTSLISRNSSRCIVLSGAQCARLGFVSVFAAAGGGLGARRLGIRDESFTRRKNHRLTRGFSDGHEPLFLEVIQYLGVELLTRQHGLQTGKICILRRVGRRSALVVLLSLLGLILGVLGLLFLIALHQLVVGLLVLYVSRGLWTVDSCVNPKVSSTGGGAEHRAVEVALAKLLQRIRQAHVFVEYALVDAHL